ncbi:MAG: hypothetical protein ACOYD0_04870 [Candidatus Nanopelagicales bacterium]
MNPRSAAEVLDAMFGDALAELQLAAGSTSMCDLSRTGTPVPALKYREGAWAVLAEVRSRTVHDLETVLDAAELTQQVWSAELDRIRVRGAGVDWLAYRTGGVDALARLLEAVQGPTVSLSSDFVRDGHEVVEGTSPG